MQNWGPGVRLKFCTLINPLLCMKADISFVYCPSPQLQREQTSDRKSIMPASSRTSLRPTGKQQSWGKPREDPDQGQSRSIEGQRLHVGRGI